MAVYTVHEPPLKRYQSEPDPERFVFVRDGFAFWAFLLGPLWMLRHRMWLVLLGYVATVAVLELTLQFLNVSRTVSFTVGVLLAVLVGVEAATLRRFSLARRRWRNVGLIVSDDLESAERRFFDAWVKADPSVRLPPPDTTKRRMPAAVTDVIGLFPQRAGAGAGAPR